MTAPIQLSVPVDDATFDEVAYLAANPDVNAAVGAGHFASGRDHYDAFGVHEGRCVRASLGEVANIKRARIEKILRSDMARLDRGGKPDFLTQELRSSAHIVDTKNISEHSYDQIIIDALEEYPGELALDCGAGRRDVYYHDVVNYEIVDYDSTDVLGVGEDLPFLDNSFSVVISVAVLEHVRDPFRCAAELMRVLRPGGRLICAYPFLQPVHGYPHHYFNATPQGARRLFEDTLRIDQQTIPASLHPIWALQWIVQSWTNGLDAKTQDEFLDQPVRNLLGKPRDLIKEGFCVNLSPDAVEELACGSLIVATKPNPLFP